MVVKLPLTIFIQELKVQGNLIIVYQLTHEHFKHVNNTHWQKRSRLLRLYYALINKFESRNTAKNNNNNGSWYLKHRNRLLK